MLRLAFFPDLGCLGLDTLVTDEGSFYGVTVGLDAVCTAVFDKICPDAMRT